MHRQTRSALACTLLALLAGCSSMPPNVDTREFVPLTLTPATMAGVRDARADFRQRFCQSETATPEELATGCEHALRRFRGEVATVSEYSAAPVDRQAFRIAFVPGMAWDCMRDLINEEELPTAALHTLGYDTQLFNVEGLSTSERNAALIAEAIRDNLKGEDQRPFIVFGYSKGAADMLVALERYPDIVPHVAAMVTVAGAVGGSPAANHVSELTMASLRKSPFGDCSGSDGHVLESLEPKQRHAWIADHLPLSVPHYALITAPEPERVSQALRSSYKLLGAVHPINDGALLHWDQLLPGATLLGYANADHWAVAVPIHVDDIPLGGLLVNNQYPRNQLWLAMADFVVNDLSPLSE